mmetsp:Transcript_53310/g.140137  ORF Transcript_53310/g.140137 Transcript_53310/m.140137 type:complete len:84 (-) Transcript_53310:156-407(-)
MTPSAKRRATRRSEPANAADHGTESWARPSLACVAVLPLPHGTEPQRSRHPAGVQQCCHQGDGPHRRTHRPLLFGARQRSMWQ